MKGKRGLIMGVANDHSIAWGIAKALAAQGAELAFTYQGEALGKRVKPLAEQLGVPTVLPCDVEDIASVDAVFDALRATWGQLDFLVHAIGFSDKNELKGRYADTSRENFSRTLVISCFSFTELAKRAAAMMPERGGSMITLTYGGSTRVLPNYNVMGVAKAALEASVRYLAADFGPRNIRVNTISAGPIRTLAGAGIADQRAAHRHHRRGRRFGTVSVVGSVDRGDRGNPLCRFRLQHHFDAPAGRFEERERGGVGAAIEAGARRVPHNRSSSCAKADDPVRRSVPSFSPALRNTGSPGQAGR